MSEEPRQTKPSKRLPVRPPDLVPPDTGTAIESQPSRIVPMAIVVAGLLLATLALLVIFLPMGTDTLRTKTPTQAASPPASAVPPVQQEAAAEAAVKAEIEVLIGDWLREQAEAEAGNISVWGGEAYAEAIAREQECERLFGAQQYQQADAEAGNISTWGGKAYAEAIAREQECERLFDAQQYQQARESCSSAIAALDRLVTAKPDFLDQHLVAGTQALEKGEAGAAADLFRQALEIDAGNEVALAGIRRAEALPKVLQFIKDGTELESAGDTAGALLAFEAAVSLDPAYQPAREALNRVETSVADRAFQQVISQALQALSAGRLNVAEKALQQAATIRAGDPAIKDLRQQLARKQLAVRLDSLRQESARLEQAERWPEALSTCEKALSLDAQASFAAACKERVTRRVELDKQLQGFLASPERLFEEAPLNAARHLLAFAKGIEPRGPRLAGQLERLAGLVAEAEAEVEVVIKSDGQTEISIYHVGRLGSFLEKRLVLRTGNYIATGNRKGYRDIRQTLRVRPGSGTLEFTLLCKEPI